MANLSCSSSSIRRGYDSTEGALLFMNRVRISASMRAVSVEVAAGANDEPPLDHLPRERPDQLRHPRHDEHCSRSVLHLVAIRELVGELESCATQGTIWSLYTTLYGRVYELASLMIVLGCRPLTSTCFCVLSAGDWLNYACRQV